MVLMCKHNCSILAPHNKGSKCLISTQDPNPTCINDTLTTLLRPFPEAGTRSNNWQPLGMTFIQSLISPGPSLMRKCLFSTSSNHLNRYVSSHPIRCKNSISYGQFLRLRRICTDNEDFDVKSKEMANLFRNRGRSKDGTVG